MRSPPDGPDGRDADRGRLSHVEPTDGRLEELLDQLGRHGRREAAGCPQRSAQEERRRCWSDGTHNNNRQESTTETGSGVGVGVGVGGVNRPKTSTTPTSQVEIGQDDARQEAVHVKLDTAVLHVLCDDGLHGAQSQHAGLVDLPPSM